MDFELLTTSLAANVKVVLVESIYAFNIGQVSRAMSNMGFEDLILIRPKGIESTDNFEARQGAARGQGALKNAKIFETWNDFFENNQDGIRIAFSRRPGLSRQVSSFKSWIKSKENSFWSNQPIYLIFGPEDRGLENHDLVHAHHVLELPVFGDHGSFNLSHSVLMATYMLRDWWVEQEIISKPPEFEPEYYPEAFPDEIIKEWLIELGFALDEKKINIFSTLKTLMLKNEPSLREYRALEAVIFQTVRKLREKISEK